MDSNIKLKKKIDLSLVLSDLIIDNELLKCRLTIVVNCVDDEYPKLFQICDRICEPRLRRFDYINKKATYDYEVNVNQVKRVNYVFSEVNMSLLKISVKSTDSTQWDVHSDDRDAKYKLSIKVNDSLKDRIKFHRFNTHSPNRYNGKVGDQLIAVRIVTAPNSMWKIVGFLSVYVTIWIMICFTYFFGSLDNDTFLQTVSAGVISLVVSSPRMIDERVPSESLLFTLSLLFIISLSLTLVNEWFLIIPSLTVFMVLFGAILRRVRFKFAYDDPDSKYVEAFREFVVKDSLVRDD